MHIYTTVIVMREYYNYYLMGMSIMRIALTSANTYSSGCEVAGVNCMYTAYVAVWAACILLMSLCELQLLMLLCELHIYCLCRCVSCMYTAYAMCEVCEVHIYCLCRCVKYIYTAYVPSILSIWSITHDLTVIRRVYYYLYIICWL
jgi:hypothetical protein